MPESRRRKSKGGAAARVTYSRPKPAKKKRLIIIGVIIAAVAAGAILIATLGDGDETAVNVGSEVVSPSGLKYVDLVEGTGPSPVAGQTVTVHYTGTLLDGSKFESSLDTGQPANFRIGVGQVIKGWDEGLMTMKVGGKRKLTVPPHLGYKNMPRAKIPANSTLVFEVELLGVK